MRHGQLTSASDPYLVVQLHATMRRVDLTSVDNAGTPGVPHVVLTYGYDVYGDKTSLTDSLGGSISYGYDCGSRLTSMGSVDEHDAGCAE